MADTKARTNEVKAGLFLILAIAIFVVGTLWIVGLQPWRGARESYEILMQSSSGVRRGDRVRISGVEVGRVHSVELRPGEEWPVLFRVTLDGGVYLTVGSTARHTTDGLLGAPYLEIILGPTDAERLPPGSRIVGSTTGTVTEAFEGLGQATEDLPRLLEETTEVMAKINAQIEPLATRLHALLSEENVDSLSRGLSSLRPMVQDVGERLATLVERLDAVAQELQDGVGEITPVVEDIGGLVTDLRQALGPEGERLAGVLDSTRTTLGSADGALSAVDANSAELDAMIRDLRDAAANLKSLSQTLKERPGLLLRYPRPPERTPAEGDKR